MPPQNNPSPAQKSRKFGVFLIALMVINFFWLLGTKISDMLLDLLIKDFQGDPKVIFEQIQQLDSVFNFTVAFAVIFWGIIVDRFPQYRKSILILNNGFWIVANLILFFSPITIPLYAFIQICWGITIGSNGPVIFSYLGDMFDINYRGHLFSTFATVLYITKGGVNAITGLIGTGLNSWKSPSLIMAIGGLIVIVLFALLIEEPKLAQIEPEFKDKIAKGEIYKYHLNPKDIKLILKQRTNQLFLLQGFFGMIGVTIVNRYIFYWFSSQYMDGMEMSSSAVVFLLVISGGIGALIGINVAGRYADHQFNKGNLDKMLYFSIICLFGQIIGYALLIFGPQYPAKVDSSIINPFTILTVYPVFWSFFIIFNCCLLFGTGIGPVVGVARTHINLPEHRGTAAALYDTTDFIGAGVGLILGSMFATGLNSFRITIFLGSLAWIVSGIIWVFITKCIKKDYAGIRAIMQQHASE